MRREEARVVGVCLVIVVQRADELATTFVKVAIETEAVVFQTSFHRGGYGLPVATGAVS